MPGDRFSNLIGLRLMEMFTMCLQIVTPTDRGVRIIYCEYLKIRFIVLHRILLLFAPALFRKPPFSIFGSQWLHPHLPLTLNLMPD